MNGLDLDDLPRRLADLADAAGPWDDPMPAVRRRVAQASPADADAGLNADVTADPDPDVTADRALIRPRPAAGRATSRWWRSFDPFTIASVAAVMLLVVGLGWLIHGAGSGDSSKKSADSASTIGVGSSAAARAAPGSSASAAAGTARPRFSAPVTAPVPLPASQCGFPSASSDLSVAAPASVGTGAVLSVRVRLASGLAGRVQTREVVALAQGRVVGRLVPTSTKAGPGAVPQAVDVVVTGTLRSTTCAQVTPTPGSTTPRSLPATALAPGRYQLIVVVTSARASTVSAPVAVTVTR